MPDYVIKDEYAVYFLTFQTVGCIDIFTRKRNRDIAVSAFNYCIDHKQLQVYSWVIMSNHIHCLVRSKGGHLSATIRDLKAHIAREILRGIYEGAEDRRQWILPVFAESAKRYGRNKNFQVWAHDNHAVQINPLRHDMGIDRVLYIHDNPVRAGIVSKPEDYLYSSARDFANVPGLIKLVMW